MHYHEPHHSHCDQGHAPRPQRWTGVGWPCHQRCQRLFGGEDSSSGADPVSVPGPVHSMPAHTRGLSDRQIVCTLMSSSFRSPRSEIAHRNPCSGKVKSTDPRPNSPVSWSRTAMQWPRSRDRNISTSHRVSESFDPCFPDTMTTTLVRQEHLTRWSVGCALLGASPLPPRLWVCIRQAPDLSCRARWNFTVYACFVLARGNPRYRNTDPFGHGRGP